MTSDRQRRLTDYYDRELEVRVGRDPPAQRLARRDEFVALMQAEGRHTVLEVGAGACGDGRAMAAAGLAWTGVDLSVRSVEIGARHDLDVRQASILDLPFPADTCEAGWSMSTIVHVAEADLARALAEVARVLRPGAPLAVGTWGADEPREGWVDDGTGFGERLFSNRTDEALRAALARIGTVEVFDTWPGPTHWHYQWALVRIADRRTAVPTR